MSDPIALAFLWHMHQPLYRVGGEHVCAMPWVRLHSIRSYYDMVRVLDEFPAVHVTINLVPSLVEQIRAYEGGASDLFWETGAVPADALTNEHKRFLFGNFFTAQEHQMIRPLPAFARLFERRREALHSRGEDEAWLAFDEQDWRDLQALFDLSWFGFMACEDFPHLRVLRQSAGHFDQQDIDEIHATEKEIIARLLPLYQAAAGRGQVEIATSPYFHPIVPLLIDSDSARAGLPQAPLPRRFCEPGDARAQIEDGLAYLEKELGIKPKGMWPPEGSVSDAAATAFAAGGASWIASDEEVLSHSERAAGHNASAYRAWSTEAGGEKLALVFRDHDLSDRVGFSYQHWNARDAVGDLLDAAKHHVHKFHRDDNLVVIALDGENPWEHYADGGSLFLRELYGRVSGGKEFVCRSVGEAVRGAKSRAKIASLRPGSWIYGNFGTWIGGPQKNHAWDILGECRERLRGAMGEPGLAPERVERARHSLLAAEGSDWFWWLDGQFSSDFIPEFDRLFRAHLSDAFESLGQDVPEVLRQPLADLPGAGNGRALQAPLALLDPIIDGTAGGISEWAAAQRLAWPHLREQSTMARSVRVVNFLWFGFSAGGDFCLRLDPADTFRDVLPALSVSATQHGTRRTLRVKFAGDGSLAEASASLTTPGSHSLQEQQLSKQQVRASRREIVELRCAASLLGFIPGQSAQLEVELESGAGRERLRPIDVEVPVWNVKAGT